MTFSADPDCGANDIEVLIPNRAWEGFKKAISTEKGGMFRLK